MTATIPVLPVCVHAVHRDSCAGPLYFYRYRGKVAVSICGFCGFLTAVSSNGGGDCQYD